MGKRGAVLLCVALLFFATGCGARYESIADAVNGGAALGENVYIDGVNVSGMAVADAVATIDTAHAEKLRGCAYTVSVGGKSVALCGLDMPVSFNTQEIVLEALALKAHYPAGNPPRELFCSMTVDETRLLDKAEDIADTLYVPPVDATAEYDDAEFEYTAHENGAQADCEHIAAYLYEGLTTGTGRAINARTRAIPPEYTLDMAKRDTSLVSEFTTSFAGSTYGKKNRVYNIVKAAQLIDGTVIEPGGEFDINAVLGDRNGENGWREATGIRYGKYVQEYGGGVCQVSTTLYNAALMAELTITERHHHSWPLGYVGVGRDATISTDGPNLRFVNDGDALVTIAAQVDEKKKTVIVRIYGRPLENGVHIKLFSKKVETLDDPGDELVLDAALAPGTRVLERESRAGCVAETYKEYYGADGELIERVRVTRDKYRPIKGIIYVSADVYHREGNGQN